MTMKVTDIKQKLKEHNVTMVGIAKSLGITHTAVCLVIKGTSKSARVSQAISDAIGVPVSEIWPEPATEDQSAA